MRYKKIMILTIILTSLLAVSTVSAAENATDNIVSTDVASEDFVSIDIQNITEVSATENNKLSASSGTFTDLANEIANADGELNLTRDYAYSSSVNDEIRINKTIIINGNGFIVNASLVIQAPNVKINNISFLNPRYHNMNDISWYGANGTLSNCKFINSKTSVFWAGDNAVVTNCSFVNSSQVYWASSYGVLCNCNFINSYSGDNGGAIHWFGNYGNLLNCSFINCSSTTSNSYSDNCGGGAICWDGAYGNLSNCIFIDSSCICNGLVRGGADILWRGDGGSLTNCEFTNSSLSTYEDYPYGIVGESIFWVGSNGKLDNCSFNKHYSCNDYYLVRWKGLNGTLSNCKLSNYLINSSAIIYWDGVNGTVCNCTFVNCSSNYIGHVIYWYGVNGTVCNCTFVNCSSHGYGVAILWYKEGGNVLNSNFNNCFSKKGGVIFLETINCKIYNCSFFNCSSEGDSAIDNWKSTSVLSSTFINCFSKRGSAISSVDDISNCTFINCSSSDYGGAIRNIDNVSNSIFVNCSAGHYGGAIYYGNNIFNCCFVNCSSDRVGESIYISSGNGIISNCYFTNLLNSTVNDIAVELSNFNGKLINCSFVNLKQALSCHGDNVTLFNCSFINCSSKFNSPILINGNFDIIEYCNFINCSAYYARSGALEKIGLNSQVSDCNFINCILNGTEFGIASSAIYWYGINGTVFNCSFINCTTLSSKTGGVLYWNSDNGTIFDCNFSNCSSKDINSNDTIYSEHNLNAFNLTSSIDIQYNDSIEIDTTIIIDVKLNNDVTGNVTLILNNKKYIEKLNKGAASFSVNDMNPGNYNFTIVYNGDQKFKPISLTKNIEILFKESFINLPIKDSYYGEILEIKPIVNDDATGKINIFVDSIFIDTIDVNQSINLSDLSAGQHFINVIYDGDDYYARSENSTSVTVFKLNPKIVINTLDLKAGDVVLNMSISEKASGSVNININAKNYSENISAGKVSFNISNLAAGNYNCTINYAGDSNFNPLTETHMLVIELRESQVNLSVENLIYGELAIININLTKGVSGIISIYINDSFVKNISTSDYTNLSNLNEGTYVIKLVYNGNEFYSPCENITSFTVLRKSDIDFNVSNIYYGENIIIYPIVSVGATGNISVYINSILQNTILIGESLNLNNLNPGIYSIKLIYNGDGVYSKCENIKSFNVSKLDTNISVLTSDLLAGELFFRINTKIGATGLITIFVNNKNYTNDVLNGESLVVIKDLPSGDYNFTIIYSGDDIFNPNQKILPLKIQFKKSSLNLSSEDIFVDEESIISYNITEGISGYISVYDNDLFVKNISIGEEINLNNLKAGNHTIKVVYYSDGYFASCENVTKFEVYKLTPYYYVDDIYADENANISFVFDEDATGKVDISFGYWLSDEHNNEVWESNYNFTGQLTDGEVSFTIPNLEGGWIDYIIRYSGDDWYDSLNESDYIWVSYKDSPIDIDIPEINWSDNVILKPTLPNGATGDISILLDNISLANISLGDSFKYNAIKGGKHYLTIEYSGDEYFTYNETTVEFYVNKLNSNFNMESTFDSEKYISIPITLNDDANGFITVNVNGNIYSGDVINGSFNFTVTDLGAGTHNAIINYTGDDKYNNIYIAKEITVNLKNSNLNLNITNILKDQNLIIKPSLTEGATGTVSIYVDDVLKRTINAGSSYTLTKPSIGQHKIRLVYFGNTYFNSAEREFSFRVFTIYPIEAVDNQIVFGTDKKFQAKFYDEYGKILANKYVSFIVNGSEYPVKTNSDGIAVLDVDLGIGEYNVTSVSLLDESTTNKLLIFHSIQAESMIIEYGSDTRFKATFLDKTASPLKNTRIVFNIDGKDTMVTTDVGGVAILNTELSMGTHFITSINTITDENMTNKVVVVSDVDSIITIDAGDINYNKKAVVKVNIDSAYLNANVTIKITGDNGYEQIFTQKASKTITKELSNLNASKYYVYVKYEDSDLLVIQKNTTFNVLKIDPNINLSINDGFVGQEITLGVNVSDSNGTLTVKIDDGVYDGQLVDGRFVMDIDGLSVGQHSFEVLFNGDNNYNPLIKVGTFNVWNNLNFEVDFYSISIYEDEESREYVHIQKLTDNEDALLTLFIDGVKAEGQRFTVYESDDEYCGEIEFNASNLSEGIHNWKITYYDEINYINSSQSGLIKVYHVGNPDKMMLVTNDGLIADIDGEFVFVNNGTIKIDDDYEEYYTIYSFTADGVEYAAIRWFPVTFYSVGCYKVFNPNEYKSFEGIYYKTTNGLISEVIGSYEEIEGIYYAYVGRPYEYYNNGYDLSYSVINGTCYKSQYYHYYEAVEGVDYKVVDGIYYTIDDIKIDDESEYYNGFVIIKNGRYYFNDNLYFRHIMSTVGYEYVKVNNDFYRLIQTYENEELHNYALIGGKLYPVIGDSIGDAVKINVTQTISEDEIHIPSLDNISGGESIEIKLPSDATGTVTLTVNGKDYNFNVENGMANIKLPELANGNYNYTITYSGDSKYSSFTSSDVMVVNKTLPQAVLIPDVTIPPLNDGLADGFVIVIVPSDVSGKVTLSIDGKKYNFNVNNGKSNVTIPDLADGTYEYSITYVASSKYANYTDIGLLVVNNTKPEDTKPTPEIVIPPLDNPSDDGSVTITLPSDATGIVTLTINGKDYPFAIVNGKSNVLIPNWGEGNYPYTITYSGDSKYSSFANTGTLTKEAPKVDPVITAKNTNVLYTSNGKYSVTVYGTDGKVAKNTLVIFKINGKQVGKGYTNANGVATYTVKNVPGSYKIVATALGVSTTKTLTVKHVVTLKTATLKKSAKKLTLQATLAKVNGKYLKNKKITFKINGKKVATAKTNAKGVAKITIKNPNVVKNLKVGKKVTYQATYLKDTVKKTTKIKK